MTGQDWRRKRLPGDPPRRPLRLLEKPEEISVPLSEVPDGPPVRFRWRQARVPGRPRRRPRTHRHGMVETERPRERERPKKTGLTRDYFRVETRDGQRFWLYRDGLYRQNGFAPRWYLQGLFA